MGRYSEKEHDLLMKNIKRFQRVLDFLDNHYTEKVGIDQLADLPSF